MDFSFKVYLPTLEGSGRIIINIVRNKFMSGATASLKKLCDHPSHRADLTVGTSVPELRNLKAMGVIGSQSGLGQVVAPTAQGKVEEVTIMSSRVKTAIRIVCRKHNYDID